MNPLEELLGAIAAFVGADPTKAKELAKAMRGHDGAGIVAQELVAYGAGKKKGEMGTEVTRLTRELETAQGERDEALEALETLKAKTPDVQQVEQRLAEKHTKAIKQKDDLIAEKDRTLKGALVRSVSEKLVSVLVTKHRVDPDYAREVLAKKYHDRFTAGDDGSVAILQLGGTEPYDVDGEDAQVDALATAVAKTVPPRYVLSAADSGSGLRGAGGGTQHRRTPDEVKDEKRRSNPMYRM